MTDSPFEIESGANPDGRKFEPSDVERCLSRVEKLIAMNRIDDARREAQDAVARDPQQEDLWAVLARIENSRLDSLSAISAAQQALALNPHNMNALFELGPALFRVGKQRAARKTMDQLVSLAPHWAPGHVQRAVVYVWDPRWSAYQRVARKSILAALSLDPLDANNYGHAAEVYFATGNRREAIKFLKKGLALEPTSEYLLLVNARVGGRDLKTTIESTRNLLSGNPVDLRALRLLHVTTWDRVSHLIAWPSFVGACSATFAYVFFPGANAANSRLGLIALVVGAMLVWVWMFQGLRSLVPEGERAIVARAFPVRRIASLVTVAAIVGLIVGVGLLLTMPLENDRILAWVLSLLGFTVVALSGSDIVIRIASTRLRTSAGIYPDTAEGNERAKQFSQGSYPGTILRVITVVTVFRLALQAFWSPGVFALMAITLGLAATVFVKWGTLPTKYRRITPTFLFITGSLAYAGAIVFVVVQLWTATQLP